MIVQISRLETHQAPRAGVRLLLADLVHPLVPLEECTVTETGLAPIAGERLLHVHRRRHRLDRRRARGRGRGVRHLVHPQVAQGVEAPRANVTRVPHGVLHSVLELGQDGMAGSYMVIQL